MNNNNASDTGVVQNGTRKWGSSPVFNYKKFIRKKLPILGWLPHYKVGYILEDFLAGFTVGLTEIPQGIAYAAVAGLDLQYGLYSGFMGCFVYFIFGTVKDINMGPTAIMALMVQSFVLKMGPAMAVLISFIAGCIVLLLGLLQLGFIVDFFSYPVIAGFTSAAALNIASSQIKSLLGIPGKSESFLETWQSVFENIGETRKWDVTLGVITIAFLIFAKEIKVFGSFRSRENWTPLRNIFAKFVYFFSILRNILAVIIGAVLAYCLDGTDDGKNPFKITGKVEGGLPEFKPPPFSTSFEGKDYDFMDMISEFGTTILFCPLIAMLETFAIAKVFSKGKVLDGSQEMVALGISNILGSFVSSMPVTGSFTRTALNNASGVRTTAGGLVTGAMVLLALSFLTSLFYYIPKATLAAVIICAMIYLVEYEALPMLWRTKKLDVIPFVVTFACCTFISLEYGIMIGIVLNLSFILYGTARPKIEVEENKLPQGGDVYIVTPKTALHFPAAEHLRDAILKNCSSKGVIVIDGKYVGNIDATVAKVIQSLAGEILGRGQKLIFWNWKPSMKNAIVAVDGSILQYFNDASIDEILADQTTERINIDVDNNTLVEHM